MYKIAIIIFIGLTLLTHCFLLSATEMNLIINKHKFVLKVAKTPREQYLGLMYQQHLPQSSGMIFIGDKKGSSPMKMWMKNTYIPLDMLFIDTHYKIACIKKNTKPLSLKMMSCAIPAIAVIEINSGEADKYHLLTGMKISNF